MVSLCNNNIDPFNKNTIELYSKTPTKRVQLPKLRHLSIYNYGMAIENMTT